jgi:hypothetical protein
MDEIYTTESVKDGKYKYAQWTDEFGTDLRVLVHSEGVLVLLVTAKDDRWIEFRPSKNQLDKIFKTLALLSEPDV